MEFQHHPSALIFCFDIESTGTDTANDRIVQIAYQVINTDFRLISAKSMILNPGIAIPEAASAVHGIYPHDVYFAPAFKEIATELASTIFNCHTICGYNSNAFDVPMLLNEFARAGVTCPFTTQHRFVDVFTLYKKLHPSKLSDVYKRLTGEELQNAHNSQADIEATIVVLDALTKRYPEIGTTPDEWQDYCGGMDDPTWFYIAPTETAYRFAKGKHKGDFVGNQLNYCQWMMREPMPLQTKAVLCRIYGADLWQSIAAGTFVFTHKNQSENSDLPF